jgi:phage terminase Nu1 subunit (DNA packaging protein)
MKANNWVHPNTVTGPPAEGQSYLRREYINDCFWREIEKGNHILFTAPRRVGKSSIMKDLAANSRNGFVCHFEIIENERTDISFYKRLFNILANQLNSIKKNRKHVKQWFKKRGVDEISISGTIKFKRHDVDYKEELIALIAELGTIKHKAVIFLDEFPEVIMATQRNQGDEKAIDLLHTMRAIRHNNNFKNCIFVLAGSVGLEQVVKRLDRPKLINDLHRIKISALTKEEAIELIQKITKGATIKIKNDVLEYLLNKIEHLIPYYIQSLIEKCNEILHKQNRPELCSEDIDIAFEEIIRNDVNLHDWESRLKDYLTNNEYKFYKELLTKCAHTDFISTQECFNISAKYSQEDECRSSLDSLERDGYLIEKDETYRFVSPIIKQWWKRQFPLINTDS